mmetsp:Transcript_15437/g.22696  ORF Transcript_15437/g.22696 Transcript_15437/m.22696 type:complete len:253 (+) Transcript_15437:389-1147(+)
MLLSSSIALSRTACSSSNKDPASVCHIGIERKFSCRFFNPFPTRIANRRSQSRKSCRAQHWRNAARSWRSLQSRRSRLEGGNPRSRRTCANISNIWAICETEGTITSFPARCCKTDMRMWATRNSKAEQARRQATDKLVLSRSATCFAGVIFFLRPGLFPGDLDFRFDGVATASSSKSSSSSSLSSWSLFEPPRPSRTVSKANRIALDPGPFWKRLGRFSASAVKAANTLTTLSFPIAMREDEVKALRIPPY